MHMVIVLLVPQLSQASLLRLSPESTRNLCSSGNSVCRFFIVLFGSPGLVSTSPDNDTVVCSTATLKGQLFPHCSPWREIQDLSQCHPTVTVVCSSATLGGELFLHCSLWRSRIGLNVTWQLHSCLLDCYFGRSVVFAIVLFGGPGLVSTSPDSDTIV